MNILPASGDPLHRGHIFLLNQSGSETCLLIGQNPTKNPGLLSTKERYNDALISLFVEEITKGNINHRNGDQAVLSLRNRIILGKGVWHMAALAWRSNKIIRGVRSEEDREYSQKLGSRIGGKIPLVDQWWKSKLTFIEQSADFQGLSSTKYKLAFPSVVSRLGDFPRIYSSWLNLPDITRKCEGLVEQSESLPDNLTRLQDHIEEYHALVCFLSSRGWFRDFDKYLLR